jgi:DivIVA domain-containing protein
VTLLQILVVLAVVAAVAAVAAGVLRGGAAGDAVLPEPTTTTPALRLPVDRLTVKDLDGVRFSLGFRGYRMDEVDQVLDRVRDELRTREEELAHLQEQLRIEPEPSVDEPTEGLTSDELPAGEVPAELGDARPDQDPEER